MMLFGRQRPRAFHHEYIYADERKRRLKEIEQRARRELGLDQMDGRGDVPRFNVSIQPGKHVSRRKSRKSQGMWNMNILILSFIVILLVIVCRLLFNL